MINKNEVLLDEKLLQSLGAKTLNIIKSKGLQLEQDIISKLEQLEKTVIEGSSANGLVKTKVDGNHQVLEISIDPSYADWASDKLKICTLITEAINDAIYKVDLTIETEISTIKYQYTKEIIDETSKE